jgi:Arc/MetJ-type ribon-helix-helix transcriptional regulator
MKVSVSLPEADVDFLDAYAAAHACQSRSAAVQRAVRALREDELRESYAPAWDEWAGAGEADAWEPAVGDGL